MAGISVKPLHHICELSLSLTAIHAFLYYLNENYMYFLIFSNVPKDVPVNCLTILILIPFLNNDNS